MQIKILHLIKSLGRGGAEMLLPEAIRFHNKEKYVFHCIYFLPWKNQLVAALEEQGVLVTNLPATNNLQILTKLGELQTYIEQNGIDIVHCHLPWAGFAGRFISKRLTIPVVYTEHNKQERYHLFTKLINKYSFHLQTKVIAVSDEVAVSITKNIGRKTPIQVIANGVDTDKFQSDSWMRKEMREQQQIPEDAFVIGTVAVFRFQKRLAEWLEIFAEVILKHPQVRGIIVGAGPLQNEIEAKAKQLRLQGKLIMPGLQTDVKPWLAAMDVFMMASEFEGLPIALLEAMSMGCIPACTAAGGIAEVITDQKNGLLVPVDAWQQLVPAIDGLLSNQIQREKLAVAARATVVDRFTMRRMVTELEDLYKNVLVNH